MHKNFDGFYQGKFFINLLLETQDNKIKVLRDEGGLALKALYKCEGRASPSR